MNRFATPLLLLLVICAAIIPAQASSSVWHDADGARIRLVTAGVPDAEGMLRGALQIDLEPGWKTYWIDPGEAGVPPSISVERSRGIISAELAFPVPTRFDDGYSTWAGYDRPVLLPVTFRVEGPDVPPVIEVDVFLGICETICIPVQVSLPVEISSASHSPYHAALVEAAFEALPDPERADFRIDALSEDDKALLVEVAMPEGDEVRDLFVAGSGDTMLGVPELKTDGLRSRFSVPVHTYSSDRGPPAFFFTLVTRSGAVSGWVQRPQ